MSKIIKECSNKLAGYKISNKWGLFFDTEKSKFLESLLKTLDNEDLTADQRADKGIKDINSILANPKKFEDMQGLLKEIKQELLKQLYPNVFNYRKTVEHESDWRNYNNLNAFRMGSVIKSDGYFCKRTLQEWLELNNYDHNRYKPNESDLGWKLHFSFDRSTPDNLDKGIAIVLQAVTDHKIPSLKIIPQNKNINERTVGKDITIYISDNRPVEEWNTLLNKIEESLTQNQIEPGAQAKATEMINGSQFVSYRNDKSADGKYTQTAFNDSGEKDPLQEIRINTNYSVKPK